MPIVLHKKAEGILTDIPVAVPDEKPRRPVVAGHEVVEAAEIEAAFAVCVAMLSVLPVRNSPPYFRLCLPSVWETLSVICQVRFGVVSSGHELLPPRLLKPDDADLRHPVVQRIGDPGIDSEDRAKACRDRRLKICCQKLL